MHRVTEIVGGLVVGILLGAVLVMALSETSAPQAVAPHTDSARPRAQTATAAPEPYVQTAATLRRSISEAVMNLPPSEARTLTGEPSGDITSDRISEGVEFFARISAVSTEPLSITFDVCTLGEPSAQSETPRVVNANVHEQTIAVRSRFVPVLLAITAGDVALGTGESAVLDGTWMPIAVTFEEFAALAARDPEFLSEPDLGDYAHVYSIVTGSEGVCLVTQSYNP